MTERPVVFSASSVNAYLECHLKWFFTYVLLDPGVESEPARVGIQVHDYAERVLRHLGDDIRVADTSPRPEVKALLRVFDTDIAPTYEKPVLIEAAFQLEVNGIPYSGFIDALDIHHIGPLPEVDWDSAGRELIDPTGEVEWDAVILRDLKTTGSRPAKGKFRFNMIGYWLGATVLGHEPHQAQLDWIVRTKHPYYWPEVVGPVDDDDIAWFASVLEGVASGVARADYNPTGLGTWACKVCPHASICGPYQRFKEATDG